MAGGWATKVLADANILYSRTLRDWLSLLYLRGGNGMFQVYWTEDIMAETLYNRRKHNPHLPEAQIGGIRRTMVSTFGPNSLITGYRIDTSIEYSDVFDAHVHSAAIHGDVGIVLTANAGDFADLDQLTYEIYSADDFFMLIDDARPAIVRAVMLEQLAYWLPRNGRSLPDALRRADAPLFAERIRAYLQVTVVSRLSGSLPVREDGGA
ncbi:PIN domain-containing protein [Nocardia sp. NPDC060259]|uniref:PIN domain-containing protein n=1 Tax=Nocardia sp. NPDC060259 TaxID=3347088 RepID=UPI003651777B